MSLVSTNVSTLFILKCVDLDSNDPSYSIQNWREVAINKGKLIHSLKFIDISKIYHFGKILGIGTFGLIREAVLTESTSSPRSHLFNSVFDDPDVKTFAVKTLKKS